MFRHRFLILLILLGLLLVVHPMAMQGGHAHVAIRLLIPAVLMAVMWNIFHTLRTRAAALVLGLPVIIAHWVSDSIAELSHPWIPLAFHVMAFLFLAYAVIVILRTVYLETELTRESIYGALCGFLLIGAAFGHLFHCVDWLEPTDFQTAPRQASQPLDEHSRQALFMYFSYSALTGISDPDVTPRAACSRSLVLVESVLGQFYLLVVIAELITIRASRVSAAESPGELALPGVNSPL